jgi:hypothetical protein
MVPLIHPSLQHLDPFTRTYSAYQYYNDDTVPPLPGGHAVGEGVTAGEGAAMRPPQGLAHPDENENSPAPLYNVYQ